MKAVYLDSSNTEAMDSLRAQYAALDTPREDTIEDRLKDIIAESLDGSSVGRVFRGAALVDDDGTHYESLSFKVLSTYTVEGEVHFSGNEFTINYSSYAAELLELAEEAFAGVDVAS